MRILQGIQDFFESKIFDYLDINHIKLELIKAISNFDSIYGITDDYEEILKNILGDEKCFSDIDRLKEYIRDYLIEDKKIKVTGKGLFKNISEMEHFFYCF